AIRIDPLYETTVRTSSPAVAAERKNEDRGSGNADPEGARSLLLDPLSSGNADPEGARSLLLDPLSSLLGQSPWGAQQPDYVYSFREKPVSGTLELRPRSPRVRAHCSSEIVLAAGRAAVLTRLLLHPEVGSPDNIDLLVSAPVSSTWNWRSAGGRNAVKGMQRLPTAEVLPWLLPLGAGTPL